MGMLRVLGMISGIIGFWSFGEDMFPVQGDGGHGRSNYKIFFGINGAADPGDDGEQGTDIGHGGMFPSLESGSDETITVPQTTPQQAVTIKLFADTDAVCIAAIAATLHDGTHWGWVGDWGMICGLDWYYSGITQPQWDGNSPMCTWLDKDHSNGIKAGGMGIYWPSFSNTILPGDGGVSRCLDSFGAWDEEGGSSVINPAAGGQPEQQAARK